MTSLWIALIISSFGSLALKFAGLSLPQAVLDNERVRAIARYLPLAMLSALVIVGLFDGGGQWAADWRALAGFTVAVGLLLLRQSFVVVFLGAVATTALLRFFLPG